jgi:diacylglycerol kinase (ATP)
MKYTFIINPKSGGKNTADHLTVLIKNLFRKSPGNEFEIIFTEYAGHARKIASDSVTRSRDIIVAAGGDGTVNEVCSSLVNTRSSFGLIPGGSGNGFARSLGIPLKTEQAIHRLINPRFQKIDVGKINNVFFFGVAGIGLDANIGDAFQNFGTRGPLPYFYIGIKEYLNYKYEELTLVFEGKELKINPLLITIANTKQYGNGAIIAPEADYKDGLLDICIVDRFQLVTGLRSIHKLFNGRISTAKFYRSFKVSDLEIERSDSRGLYHVDGEPMHGNPNLKVSVLKKVLSVCV